MSLEKKCLKIKETGSNLLGNASADDKARALACVETLVALYFNVLNVRAEAPQWLDRDRFIMGAGAPCAALCAVLLDMGYFPVDELGDIFSAQGSVDIARFSALPGVDAVASAPGEALKLAVDTALKARSEIKIYKSFVIIDQRDCLSGMLWENAIKASESMLEDLTVILCRPAGNILPGCDNICAKFSAFGFDTLTVSGKNVDAVTLALMLPRRTSRPRFLCCDC